MVRILLQQVRRDRLTLPIWIAGTVIPAAGDPDVTDPPALIPPTAT